MENQINATSRIIISILIIVSVSKVSRYCYELLLRTTCYEVLLTGIIIQHTLTKSRTVVDYLNQNT